MQATIKLKKTDLAQYGEKYEVIVNMDNGCVFAVDIPEHQFDNLIQFFGEPVKSGAFERDETYS